MDANQWLPVIRRNRRCKTNRFPEAIAAAAQEHASAAISKNLQVTDFNLISLCALYRVAIHCSESGWARHFNSAIDKTCHRKERQGRQGSSKASRGAKGICRESESARMALTGFVSARLSFASLASLAVKRPD